MLSPRIIYIYLYIIFILIMLFIDNLYWYKKVFIQKVFEKMRCSECVFLRVLQGSFTKLDRLLDSRMSVQLLVPSSKVLVGAQFLLVLVTGQKKMEREMPRHEREIGDCGFLSHKILLISKIAIEDRDHSENLHEFIGLG